MGDPGSGALPKDESKESPRAEEPANPYGNDDVAPAGAEQSSLTLRGLNEALNDPARLKELEERTGVSKERLEQFAKQYEKPKVAPGREAKDVEVKVGEQAPVAPGADLPGAQTKRFNLDAFRGNRGIKQDESRGLNEGNRDEPPPELKERYFNYKSRLGRASRTSSPRQPATPQAGGQK
jgi:hypothetical protein